MKKKFTFQVIFFSLSLFMFSLNSQAQCAGNCGVETVGNCGCDTDCWLYGDCCPDIVTACPDIRPSDPPMPPPPFPGGGGIVNPLACNPAASICTPGVAGPFNFDQTTPGPPTDFANPVGCATGLYGNPNGFGFIILNITSSGALNLLVDGNSGSGFIDVVVYNIPPGVAPCVAVMNSANEIGCNYAPAAVGCTQFGTSLPGCSSSVPAPFVTAGQQLMVIVHDYSSSSSNFTLQLGPGGAQTGPPNATINPTPSPCATSAPVTLTAVSNGGTWSGPGMSSNGNFNPAIAGVGTHTINYTVGNAPCVSSSTAQITVNQPPVASFSTNSPICVGQTLTLTPVETPGATYHWSGPGGWTATGVAPTRPNATVAMSGVYSHYIVLGGCTSATVTQNVVVNATAPAPPILSNSPVCHGNALNFDGPTIPGAQYFWSGPNSWAEASEDPIIGTTDYSMTGDYSLYIVLNGCTSATATHPVQITVPPKPTIAPIAPLCFGGASVNLTVDRPGGTFAGTGITDPVSGQFNPVVAGSGTHTVIYTIPEPCGSADTLEITVTNELFIQGAVTDETCPEVGDGQIDITVTGDVGPFVFNWSNGANVEDATGLVLGNYSVLVTDPFGCEYTDNFFVSSGNSLNFSYATQDVLCFGQPTGQIIVTPLSGNPPYTYTVNGNVYNTNLIGNLTSGTYAVNITDSRGCDTAFVTTITQPAELIGDSLKYQLRMGDYTLLSPATSGGTGAYTFQWIPALNLSCADCPNPMAWPSRDVDYNVIITDENGCVVNSWVSVDVFHDGPFIPNSFTPGKDDLNNVWLVSDYGVKSFEVLVFDRWGTKVFESDNIYQGWDGKLKNGTFYEVGVYVYKVNIKYIDGTEKTLLGNINLIR